MAGRPRASGDERLVDELAYTYDGTFSRPSIAHAVASARAALEPTASVANFLPVLVARFAREQLAAAAQADGRLAKPVPELLFVCVHNAGRSQMAAALAQHLSAGKVHVRSAGSQPTGLINPVAVQVLGESDAGKRYLDWDVADPNGRPIDQVRDIRDDLQARVTALLRDLDI